MTTHDTNHEITNELISSIRSSLSQFNVNPFDVILDRIKIYYERPCSNVLEFKRRTLKVKGDIWEQFCVMYLKAKGYTDVWLLQDVPDQILEQLNLRRKDDGIDIIATKTRGNSTIYFAVQAKYRIKSRTKPHTVLGWTQLSTFYSLCARTGPWVKYVVMTNCDSVSRRGRKSKMDYTIALARFQSTSREFWSKLIGDPGHKLSGCGDTSVGGIEEKKDDYTEVVFEEEKHSSEDLRNKRLEWFSKLKGTNTKDL